MFIFWVILKENGLKHTNNSAVTERRQSKANNTERENIKGLVVATCNNLKESTGLVFI